MSPRFLTRDQTPACPYGWASQAAPGKARNASGRHKMKGDGSSDGDMPRAQVRPWGAGMGRPGTRGHARMLKRMSELQAKGGVCPVAVLK